jgi:1-pyrroline-5-carboxylate dehydrogenase
VKEIFLSKLVEKVRGFRIGNPLMKENYVGPLISAAALERYNKAVSEAERSGRIVFGGRTVKNSEGGIYVEPAIAEVDSSNWLFREELFAPFLVVATYKNFDNAIAMSNSTEYGLTAGIYSRKPSEIREFMRRIEAGVVYANRVQSATTGAIVGLQTFVGWKGSGLTGKGTGSRYYLEQFMREKSMTITR